MKGKRRGRASQRPGGAETPREKAMTAALRMISTRAYSEGELRTRLKKRWPDPGIVEDCIQRLKRLGYVDDEMFARSYASYRVASKPVGRARLARELAMKKVAPGQIDAALDLVFDEVAEESLIDRAIEKRIRMRGKPADRASAKRMFDHLARLGFEYDLIARKLGALRINTEDDGPAC